MLVECAFSQEEAGCSDSSRMKANKIGHHRFSASVFIALHLGRRQAARLRFLVPASQVRILAPQLFDDAAGSAVPQKAATVKCRRDSVDNCVTFQRGASVMGTQSQQSEGIGGIRHGNDEVRSYCT